MDRRSEPSVDFGKLENSGSERARRGGGGTRYLAILCEPTGVGQDKIAEPGTTAYQLFLVGTAQITKKENWLANGNPTWLQHDMGATHTVRKKDWIGGTTMCVGNKLSGADFPYRCSMAG